MTDLTTRMISAWLHVGDRVVLDWLEVVRLAEPLAFGCRGRGVHVNRLRLAWQCSQSTVSRRLAAINAAPPGFGLGRIEWARGAHGWWRVLELQP